jgi:hypothetical protein
LLPEVPLQRKKLVCTKPIFCFGAGRRKKAQSPLDAAAAAGDDVPALDKTSKGK